MTTETTMADANARADAIWKDRCDLLHQVFVTYRYHRKRQRFFDLVDKGTKALTVIVGFTLFGQWFKDAVPILASFISLLSLLALVFGYSDRKQAHKELSESAMVQIGIIQGTTSSALNALLVAGWHTEFMRLNAKEPPPLKTLVILCEIEEAVSKGHDPKHIPIPPLHKRALANFW